MQLLRITSTPMKIKMRSEPAKLEMNQEKPASHISRKPGKLSMKSQTIKVKIDTYEARKSLGHLNSTDQAKAAAQKGREAVQNAAAEYAELGNRLAQAYKGVTAVDAAKTQNYTVPTQIAFLPSETAEISWEPASVETDYQPSEISTEWDVGLTGMRFVPGKFSVEVEQYADLEIEYLGSPQYVPPSANPDFKEEKSKGEQ